MVVQFDQHSSSFRDPSGFLFYNDGVLYRQVNKSFQNDFDSFINGGLYQHLVEKNYLVSHQVINENLTGSPDWHKTLRPDPIEFISYPYEWSFDMLKDAAILTLQVAREAINYGMMLKDASAYNIQLHQGKMIFIDTLSFEELNEGRPWIAYRQFCEHFFAPLALMHYLKKPIQKLFLAYPDGIPLDLVSKILPFKSKLNLHTYLHVHLQAAMSQKKESSERNLNRPFSRKKMLNLLQSLQEKIQSFSLIDSATVWSAYYQEAGQRGDYITEKKQIVEQWLKRLTFNSVLDAGANDGEFSEMAASTSAFVISADLDHSSINKLYNKIKKQKITNIYPYLVDFANPSPAIGVNNEERYSSIKRLRVDLTLALALVHHLILGRNIPFSKVADLFSSLTRYLIIEFVPEYDDKVRIMTLHKKDLLATYSNMSFETSFQDFFLIIDKQHIGNSGRTLYLMENKNA
ncbi:MAG: hypothetical protein ACXVBK_09940 [Flavisolibacter sp.]